MEHTATLITLINRLPIFEDDKDQPSLESLHEELGIKTPSIEATQEELADNLVLHIVHAVNAHDELVEAVKGFLGCIDIPSGTTCKPNKEDFERAIKAIAKAEGKN